MAKMKETTIDAKTYEDEITVCAHRVSFWFRGEYAITDEMKENLKEGAKDRAKACLVDGYLAGELYAYLNVDGMPEDMEYSGWWRIV